MIRETFGAQLPPIEESHVGDRFYNTAEDKHYVFDDGEWKAIPEAPEPSLPTPTPSDAGKALVVGEDGGYSVAASGVNQVYAVQKNSGSPLPYRIEAATPLSVFNNVYVRDLNDIDGDYVAAAVTFHLYALLANYGDTDMFIQSDEEGNLTPITGTNMMATDPDRSHWFVAESVNIMFQNGEWGRMVSKLIINKESGNIYIPYNPEG